MVLSIAHNPFGAGLNSIVNSQVMGSPTILRSGHEVTAELRWSQFVTPVTVLSIMPL